jgi:hypothetical protein
LIIIKPKRIERGNDMSQKNKKIVPIKRFNFVNIVFLIIVIYLVAIALKYAMKEKVKIYQVVEGSLATENSFEGIILRSETPIVTTSEGTIKCYVQNKDVIGLNQPLYAIDSTGNVLSQQDSIGISNSSLTKDNLTLLKGYMTSYSITYNNSNYSDVYNFKNQLQSVVNEISSQINEEENTDTSSLEVEKASQSGIVMYMSDGYESLTAKKITEDSFNTSDYKATYISTGTKVEASTTVAKIISGQDWQIVIKLTEEQAQHYKDSKEVTVYLKKIDTTADATMEIFTDSTGKSYATLSMNRYMASYLDNRFISIEIDNEANSGLKVPVSAVITKDFYIIPEEFVKVDEESDGYGIYLKDSNDSVSYKVLDVYNKSAGYYYVDNELLEKGDTLVKSKKSKKTFTVGEMKSLNGVYNVNKGYAVFKEVQIVDKNDEYYIIKSDDSYGLATYDRIVLNATSIDEDQFLY